MTVVHPDFLFSRITNVHFGTPAGILILNCDYHSSALDREPALGEPMTLINGDVTANIFSGDIKSPGLGAPVVNPVSKAMRSSLLQWSLGTVSRVKGSAVQPGSVGVWSTYSPSADRANQILFGIFTGPPTRQNFNSPTPFLSPSGSHLTYAEVWGTFTSQAAAQAFCDASNATVAAQNAADPSGPHLVQPDRFVINIVPPNNHTNFTATAQATVAVNMDKASLKNGVFTCVVRTPGMGADGGWAVRACAYDISVSNFPVDNNDSPTFPPMNGDQTNVSPTTGQLLDPKTGKPVSSNVQGTTNKAAQSVTFSVDPKALRLTITAG